MIQGRNGQTQREERDLESDNLSRGHTWDTKEQESVLWKKGVELVYRLGCCHLDGSKVKSSMRADSLWWPSYHRVVSIVRQSHVTANDNVMKETCFKSDVRYISK